MDFVDHERNQSIYMRHEKSRKNQRVITVNKVPCSGLGPLFGTFMAVVFTPEDLELSKGSPETRRLFMNTGISQIHKSYHLDVMAYTRVMNHRNAVIKEIINGRAQKSDLDIWDNQLAHYGATITYERSRYLNEISKKATALYRDISSGSEELEIYYMSGMFRDVRQYTDIDFKNPLCVPEIRQRFEENLHNSQDSDIKAGMTLFGAQRDDIFTKVNGMLSREYCSQGQSRSIALVMKLAQAQLIWEVAEDPPVILLDDVLSELDPSRQEFVLRRLKGFQVFVTCCDRVSAMRFGEGKIFYVENGKITEEN